MRASTEKLTKRPANLVVEPVTLRGMKSIIDLDLNDENIFLDPKNTYLCLQTNSKLKALLNEGDISEYQYKKFHEAAHPCYRYALDYMQKKFPISHEIIVNGAWIDIENRAKATWGQVQCFLDKYSDIEIM